MLSQPQTHVSTANYVTIKKHYFDVVVAPVFAQLVRRFEPIEKYYRIANRTVCLKFYTEHLAEYLSRALVHLEQSHDEIVADTIGSYEVIAAPDLTVHIWDSVSSQLDLAAPWSRVEYRFDQKADTQTQLDENFMGVYLHGEETLTLYDRKSKTAYFWTHDAAQLPGWVSAAPLRTLLQWFLAPDHIALVHGAVVATDDSAALITAKGGSGKSTTALSCLFSGLNYLADDYVAVEVPDKKAGQVMAHSLYNSVKVSPSHIDAFPILEPHVSNTEGPKAIVFLGALFPRQIIPEAPLRAIILPQIAHAAKTTIHKTTKAEVLRALIPTTVFQLPLAKSDIIKRLTKLIDQLPCYVAEMSADSTEVAAAIKDFLNTVSRDNK